MLDKNQALLDGAILVARGTDAAGVLLAAALPAERQYLHDALREERRVIGTTPVDGKPGSIRDSELVTLPEVRLRRRGRAKVALLEAVAAGLLHPGERVVIVSGDVGDGDCELDTIALVDLGHNEDLLDGETDAPLTALREVVDPAVFDTLLGMCVQLGHEGREGRRVGLLITLGSHDDVLSRSHPLVLNPFEGHAEQDRNVLNPVAGRAIREFSGMDGAFVVRDDGIIVSGGRYLQEVAPEPAVPPGLGTRHRAAAGITAATRCIAFVVSESTGDTRVFAGGRLLITIERTD